MTHSYPSNITREQFSMIKPILESALRRTRPRQVDLYDIFSGLLYILKSGAQLSMLSKEYPNWELCYYYFRLSTDSILEKVLKKIGWRCSKK
jgi:transposase